MRPDQEEFFTVLYREYFNQIKIYAMAHISDPHRAEEIAQDTFHTAVEKIDTLMKADEPIRWLKRTAKNKIRNEQRTRQRYLKRYLSLDAPEITMLKRIAIERACYSDVAQELGISLWACQKRMQRIRQKLSEEFPDHKKKKK